MKDIDFDELDRAVNSLMSGVPKAEPPKQDDVTTLALKAATPADDAEPDQAKNSTPTSSPDHTDETPKSDEQPKSDLPAIIPPAARRGRFMDMVRPGVAETRNPVPSRAPSRHGATIEPSAGFTHPSAPSIDGITPPASQAKQPAASLPNGSSDDPLASVDFNATTKAMTVKAEQTETLSLEATNGEEDHQPEGPSAPLTSPFIPDAKVEKRPLGRLSDTAPEPDHAPVLGALASSDQDTSEGQAASGGDTAIPQQPLPVELGEEVMAIEADTSALTPESSESTTEIKTEPVRPAAASVAAAQPYAGMTSIPQQYKVQPKVADATSGAIYDTATYHQPLTHPAKKKPGWLWVVAIILILLLGAASGAAVYFLGLV